MRLAEVSGRRVGLWGLGREGRASLRALEQLTPPPKAITIVTDAEPAMEERATAGEREWLWGDAGLSALERADVVIRSPGVSRYREDARRVAETTRMTTGTDLWFAEHADEPVIAVTGSKGKSTTTSLIAHLARASGCDALLAGNIGVPLLDHLHPEQPPQLWVLELSSHQISDLSFSPRVGVLLNLYREHVDWHGSEERYFEDKLNLFAHRDDGVAVLNAEDVNTRRYAGGLGRIAWFGLPDGYHTDGRRLLHAEEPLLEADQLHLRGRHNLLNACAGLTALEQIGIAVRPHIGALAGFRGLPHRLEVVAEIDGVTWVNDSIATIPEAVIAALETTGDRPTVLIAGGFDRGQDHTSLVSRLRASANVIAVIALPPSGLRLAEAITASPGAPPVVVAGDLGQAVEQAQTRVPRGGVVLLSPAAPSYGAFRDFEQRGDAFRDAVGRLRDPDMAPGLPGSPKAGA